MTEAEFVERIRSSLAGVYDLGPEIGRGGTAIVFKATDLERHRPVALKMLRPEVSALLGGDRFLHEIEIAANLQHPNIVPVYDSGQANGHLYYVMPLVEGTSLRSHIQEHGALPIEEAMRVAREVGDALAYAHAHDVVHRDIKPGNILLTSQHAMVSDFGVARAMADVDSGRLTESGMVVGTPAYMSPEQAGGEGRVDGRCDVYALGCVAFEMLAGEPPFTGRTAQAVLARHLLEPPPSIEVVRPNVPPPMAGAIRRALEKLPADRFESAEAFVQSLEGADLPPLRRTRSRRRRLRWAVGAVLGLALAAAAAAGWLLTRTAVVPSLDASSVTVFPLAVETTGPNRAAQASEAMLLVAATLEYAPGIRTVNGSRLLSDRQKQSLELMSPQAAAGAAREAGTRYAVVGVIRTRAGRQEVALSLLDTQGDSAISAVRASHAADSVPLAWTTLAAAGYLWSGQSAFEVPDLSPLMERSPSAIDLWARGLRLYRAASFSDALAAFRQAFEEDSVFALAAFSGGEAAVWLEGAAMAEAFTSQLFDAALAAETLPEKHTLAARGFGHYLRGDADSAVHWLKLALEVDSAWSEGWLALGEVYYHLIPSEERLDSLAEHAMLRALEHDPEFSPPLFHLAEIAIRKGRLNRADSLLVAYRSHRPDSLELRQLELMIDCVRSRPTQLEWTSTLDAGHSLAGGGYHPWCSERAFRALLGAEETPPAHAWGAIVGVQALLVAQGRSREAAAFLDSLVAAGQSSAKTLYVVGALAGANFEEAARETVALGEEHYGPDFAGVYPPWLWMFGAWFGHLGEADKVARIREALETASAADPSDARLRVYAEAVAGHLALVRGDTAEAVRRLAGLRPQAPIGYLVWELGDALAYERVVLARLLYAQGRPEEAFAQAATLDHPGPITFVEFLPLSLSLRYRIATQLGWAQQAADLEQRLTRLGREDLIHPPDDQPSQGRYE